MAGKRGAGTAVGGGALALVLIGVLHQCGAFADDAARAGRNVADQRPPVVIPKAPYVPPAVYDALTDPAVEDSVKQGITVFRQLRDGDDADKIIVGVACAGFDAFASEQSSQQRYEQYIVDNVPSSVPSFLVDKHKSTLATGMYAAEINGGLLRWYTQYCVVKPKK